MEMWNRTEGDWKQTLLLFACFRCNNLDHGFVAFVYSKEILCSL